MSLSICYSVNDLKLLYMQSSNMFILLYYYQYWAYSKWWGAH